MFIEFIYDVENSQKNKYHLYKRKLFFGTNRMSVVHMGILKILAVQ